MSRPRRTVAGTWTRQRNEMEGLREDRVEGGGTSFEGASCLKTLPRLLFESVFAMRLSVDVVAVTLT